MHFAILHTMGNGGSTLTIYEGLNTPLFLEGRKAALIDDSPLATNMEYNMFNYIDMDLLEIEYKKLIKGLSEVINGIYKTNYSTGEEGFAEVIIASNVYESRCNCFSFFAGSGTTGRVCIEENRNCILVDNDVKSKEYYSIHIVKMQEIRITNNYHISETLDDFYNEVIDRPLSNTFE